MIAKETVKLGATLPHNLPLRKTKNRMSLIQGKVNMKTAGNEHYSQIAKQDQNSAQESARAILAPHVGNQGCVFQVPEVRQPGHLWSLHGEREDRVRTSCVEKQQ